MSRLRTAIPLLILLLADAFAEGERSGPFDRLRFREIGPATPSGRIDDFAVLESNPAVFYVATATGGLWKTVNNGTTFESVFDDQPTSSIGDVAIAARDANLIWVGTGENNNRQSSSWGDGVYKSADGGKTWKNMGLAESRHIARVIVDPVDADTVYVAALGSLWGPGGQRGVFKTNDGGLTWTQALAVDADTGATEIIMDPSNRKVLYAATYQRRRAAWGFNGGGPGSGIYKSTDAGRTWTRLTRGLPEGPIGRIGLDLYRRSPNVVYARIEHAKEGGVYRSEDAGASWTRMSDVNPRPMYFSQIRIDPSDDHRIYVLGVQFHVSDDGGKTFRTDGARKIHVDFHAMWIDPNNSAYLMIGGDGGVGISYDRSKTYVWLNNLPLGQFYHVAFDMRAPYYVCGGLQDNSTWCGPSAVRSASGIANDDWFIIGGGDGFVAQMDPREHRILYSESQDGRMSRVDLVTNERKSIRPEAPEGEPPYRWNWNTPMALSAHNPATVFVAANRVFRSDDRGHSWKAISPDLTTATDRDTLELMGVKGKEITLAKNDGVGSYGTLVAFAESPKKAGLYYAGSDDGLVHVSRDGGGRWTNLTANFPGVPKNTYVAQLAPSRFDEGTVYGAFDGHRSNDFGTYVYASTDYGATWRSIAGDLPRGEVVRCLTEDLKNADVLYLGTERGLYTTLDRGKRWLRVKANLPTVPVYEITLHPRDNAMILATHGRSLWILDDLTPLQQFTRVESSQAHLFEMSAAVARNPSSERSREWEGDRIFLGKNPEPGTAIPYWLKSAAKDFSLTVRDGSGTIVRSFKGDAVKGKTEPGIHVLHWDLRVEPNEQPKGLPAGPGGGGGELFGSGLNGPFVLPGTYQVRLAIDGRETASGRLQVLGDPEIQVSDSDRKAQFDAALTLHRLQAVANSAASSLATLNDTLGGAQKALKENAGAPAALRSSVEDFAGKLEPVLRKFGVGPAPTPEQAFSGRPENLRTRIGMLKGSVLGATSRPTETQDRMLRELRGALTRAVEDANAAIARLPALLRELSDAKVYPAPVKAISEMPK